MSKTEPSSGKSFAGLGNARDWRSCVREACLLNPSPASTLKVFHSIERFAHRCNRVATRGCMGSLRFGCLAWTVVTVSFLFFVAPCPGHPPPRPSPFPGTIPLTPPTTTPPQHHPPLTFHPHPP